MTFFSDWNAIIKIIFPIVVVLSSGLIGFILENSLRNFRKNVPPDTLIGRYSLLLKSFDGCITTLSIIGAIALILPLINLPATINILAQKILIVVA